MDPGSSIAIGLVIAAFVVIIFTAGMAWGARQVEDNEERRASSGQRPFSLSEDGEDSTVEDSAGIRRRVLRYESEGSASEGEGPIAGAGHRVVTRGAEAEQPTSVPSSGMNASSGNSNRVTSLEKESPRQVLRTILGMPPDSAIPKKRPSGPDQSQANVSRESQQAMASVKTSMTVSGGAQLAPAVSQVVRGDKSAAVAAQHDANEPLGGKEHAEEGGETAAGVDHSKQQQLPPHQPQAGDQPASRSHSQSGGTHNAQRGEAGSAGGGKRAKPALREETGVVRFVNERFGFILRHKTDLSQPDQRPKDDEGRPMEKGSIFFVVDDVRKNVELRRGDVVRYRVRPPRRGAKGNKAKPKAADVELVEREGVPAADLLPEHGDVDWRRPRADSYRRNSLPTEALSAGAPRRRVWGDEPDPQLQRLAQTLTPVSITDSSSVATGERPEWHGPGGLPFPHTAGYGATMPGPPFVRPHMFPAYLPHPPPPGMLPPGMPMPPPPPPGWVPQAHHMPPPPRGVQHPHAFPRAPPGMASGPRQSHFPARAAGPRRAQEGRPAPTLAVVPPPASSAHREDDRENREEVTWATSMPASLPFDALPAHLPPLRVRAPSEGSEGHGALWNMENMEHPAVSTALHGLDTPDARAAFGSIESKEADVGEGGRGGGGGEDEEEEGEEDGDEEEGEGEEEEEEGPMPGHQRERTDSWRRNSLPDAMLGVFRDPEDEWDELRASGFGYRFVGDRVPRPPVHTGPSGSSAVYGTVRHRVMAAATGTSPSLLLSEEPPETPRRSRLGSRVQADEQERRLSMSERGSLHSGPHSPRHLRMRGTSFLFDDGGSPRAERAFSAASSEGGGQGPLGAPGDPSQTRRTAMGSPNTFFHAGMAELVRGTEGDRSP